MDKKQKEELTIKMDKALAVLEKDLAGLRAGRASVNLLDPVVIEVYGSKMPLSQVGTVSAPDAKTLTVQVWDKEITKKVEKAIVEANLGLNPASDGQLIRINLPPVSEERRKELVKISHKYGENTKIALRNIRRDAMDLVKKNEKDGDISEDDGRRYSDEIQKITDKYIEKTESMISTREKEIMNT
jgi:ribosome recycling factor